MANHGGRPIPALSPGPPGPAGTPAASSQARVPRVHRPLQGPPPGHATPPPPPRPAPPTPPRTPPRPGHPVPVVPPPGHPSGHPRPTAGGHPSGSEVPVQAEVAEVSLAMPRPDGERRTNEYVETPVAAALRMGRSGVRSPLSSSSCRKTVSASPGVEPRGTLVGGTPRHHHHRTTLNGVPPHRQHVDLPIRQQPTTFKKEPPTATAPHSAPAPASRGTRGSSILCAECGRCRCAACREPRPLPSRWLCDDACFCSAETTVDYATCLCCVKGLFYHCGNAGDEGGIWCADDPCSCAGGGAAGGAGSRRCVRWSCLALASVALPCLLCYWPLRGLVRATELCYAHYCDDGCRCERRPSRPSGTSTASGGHNNASANNALLTTPEKRLLDAD